MLPMNASAQVSELVRPSRPPAAAELSAVAPEKPSTAVQTASPEMSDGYAKKKKTRAREELANGPAPC